MTNDFSVQQQPSATPYVLGGALVGGAAGAGTAYITAPKPKYGSYEDIINEAEDAFQKSTEEVIEDTSVREKAVEARKKIVEARDNYNKELEAFKAAYQEGEIIPDENYKNLQEDLKAKTEAVEAKRTELIENKIQELKAANAENLTDEQIAKKAKDSITDDLLKEVNDAKTKAEQALEEAGAKLPKGAAKTEEELVKEFIEKNGTVDDAIKKAGKDSKEDLKLLMEKKIPNKKLAIWAAAGAAAIAALGYAIAPKKN